MNTREIERLVTAALQADAEDAMNRTDTTKQLDALIEAGQRDPRRRRRLRAAGALGAVAATAAVVAVVVASWPGGDSDTAPPAGPPTKAEQVTQAERVAGDFFASLTDFDRDGAATYLAPGAQLQLASAMGDDSQLDPWRLRNRWDEATGWEVSANQGCHEFSVRLPLVDVRCEFTAHQLGSDRLGRGPFGGNDITITVRHGTIVDATLTTAHATNGFADTVWTPFWAWMGKAHPDDEQLMAAFEDPKASPGRVNRSLHLWQQRTRGYVDAVQAGRAE